MYKETIAAIASGLSCSGINVIRISGDEAFSIIDKIFVAMSGKKTDSMKSFSINYGNIIDGDETVDEVLVMIMKAPKTYTREDVAEIDCHGGIIVTKRILEVVIKNGARIAEPGEFTKRAFLNGRIDLSQAEAVIDIINSKSRMALKNSIKQLKGDVYGKIDIIRKSIMLDLAYIEAALDDPEHMSLDGFSDKLKCNTTANIKEIGELYKTAEDGRIIKEGIKTVILGKPNAGKSSLLNMLLGENRAIVTDIAGTTRDILEENIQLNNLSLNIADTAGIRNTDDVIEKIGVEKAKEIAEDADLILYVADSSVELDENDDEVLKVISGKKHIVLLNKSDLKNVTSVEEIREKCDGRVISFSVKDGIGLDDLKNEIEDMFYKGKLDYNDDIYITGIRHKVLLKEAMEALENVIQSIDMGMPEDFYSIDMMSAYEKLGNITGEAVDDDLVDTIFKEFCMGK